MPDSTRVLVVEDDRAVARLHCKVVSRVDGFSVVGVATTTAQARPMVENLAPQLIVLDLGLPGENGLTLLRDLRSRACPVDAIAVTAFSDGKVVRAAFQLGVLDFLLKPFRPERLERALDTYLRTEAALGDGAMEQASVDAVRAQPRWLPKHLTDERLDEVRGVLEGTDEPLTADAVGDRIHASRVTARRYLEYLVETGEAEVTPLWGGVGRPPNAYRARTEDYDSS